MRFAKLHWPRRLSTRLLVAYVTGMLVSVGLVVSTSAALVFWNGAALLQNGVELRAAQIARNLSFDASGRPVGPPAWQYAGLGEDRGFRVLDAAGQVVLSSSESAWPLVPDGHALDLQRHAFVLAPGGIAMHGATTPPIVHGGRTWYVQFAMSDRLAYEMRDDNALPLILRGVFGACLVSLLVFTIAMYFTLGHMLKPLRKVSAGAARIAPSTLGARLDARGLPSELRPLIEAFNHALERLEQGYRAQQDFLAAAAHELKTPLALIRAQIEMGRGGDTSKRAMLIKDVDQMARQVHQLLHLAEASESQNYTISLTNTTTLISEVGDYVEPLAERRGVHVRLHVAPDAAFLRADRGALFTLLKNLVENAIQHSDAGGVVHLGATAAGFSVRDEGVGIPPEHLPHIFDRFWRGPERRDVGAGLGLSICREIAVAHGWQLLARPARPGTEFVLVFTSCAGGSSAYIDTPTSATAHLPQSPVSLPCMAGGMELRQPTPPLQV